MHNDNCYEQKRQHVYQQQTTSVNIFKATDNQNKSYYHHCPYHNNGDQYS